MLAYFVLNNASTISVTNKPIEAMITKLHYAAFNAPVFPNYLLTVSAKLLHYDEITGTIAAQTHYNKQLCSYSILEAYFND